MNKVKYPKVLLGTTKYNATHNQKIYLTPPDWACGWYWSWGWIGNRYCHYHLDSLFKDTNMYDGIKAHFKTFTAVEPEDLWAFCELVRTFYSLKEAAELLIRGGSHYTNNPCQELIEDADYAKHINTVLIPAIFAETYKLFAEAVNPTGAKEVTFYSTEQVN